MAVICGIDKLRCDVFLNMVLVNIGVVISSYGEIHFNIVGTVYQAFDLSSGGKQINNWGFLGTEGATPDLWEKDHI
ncbi:hypothetical protein Taro_002149 [Colocasia esculenta]|uniref:Uncharacterized protein n=1 Tax=Colocasia esculenta TaxID=4460 RepID=A0A843TGH3_COLES|nr:hypothetical protein [Colocasia esculenta]